MSTVINPGKTENKIRTMEYLPVSLFGSIMGLCGLAMAWRMAHNYFNTPQWLGVYIGYISIFCFLIMAIGYSTKIFTSMDRVRAELSHPIAGNLFSTPLINLLLLPILLSEINLVLARSLWILGTIGMTVFAWLIVSRWMRVRQQIIQVTPAWLIPVVGLIDIPLAVPSLHLQSMHGIMILSLAVGLFFAIPLITIILSRLIFEASMPGALQPSLLMLVAPFSVGFSSYVTTLGQVDAFAEALFMLTLFVLAVLVGRLFNELRSLPFRVSWWAISFPLASSSTASLRYADFANSIYADVIAIILLALATVVILGLLIRTMIGLLRGELRTLCS